MNNAFNGSSMMKAGMKTERIQKRASKRATAVISLPRLTARASDILPRI